MEKIAFKDWKKLDIRVGEILEAKKHSNANKLLVLKVDVGEERQLVAGLKEHYKLNELKGKKVVVLCNLEEANLRGEKSEGMVLAAVKDGEVVLLKPEKDIDNGSKVE